MRSTYDYHLSTYHRYSSLTLPTLDRMTKSEESEKTRKESQKGRKRTQKGDQNVELKGWSKVVLSPRRVGTNDGARGVACPMAGGKIATRKGQK